MSRRTPLNRFTTPTSRIHHTSFRSVAIRAALPAVAGALLLAGCGGSGSSGTAAAAATASATASGSTSALQACLKQHGVKFTPGARPSGFPSGARPSGFPSGARPTAFPSGVRPSGSFGGQNSAAFTACAKYAPAGFGGGGRTLSASALAAFKSCMTSHDVKVTGTTARAILMEFRTSSGKTATAYHTCQVLLQTAAPTPSAS
jgi:hypothetical protein